MAGEKARYILKRSQDATSSAVQETQESGELRHLYGKPLDLSDDSPEWFTRKLLKREGVAPPLVERGKDLDRAEREAEKGVERLRRRRAWLASPEARCTPEQAEAFNRTRQTTLDDYRDALVELNRAIRDYNLVAPLPMHRRGYRVERVLAAVSAEIAPLDAATMAPAAATTPVRPRSWLRAPWRKGRAS